MIGFVIRRSGYSLILILAATLLTFSLVRLIPGDPAVLYAGLDASQETLEAIREQLGLNEPFLRQYVTWFGAALTGDFGNSITFSQPVSTLIGNTLKPTVQLLVVAMALTLIIGSGLAILAAHFGKGIDSVVNVVTSTFIGTPPFWIGLLSLMVFSLWLGWFPAGGWVDITEDPIAGLRSIALPAMVLGLVLGSVVARFARSSILDALSANYIKAARARGLSRTGALWRHAIRNAAIPVTTVIGLMVARLLGGAVVIETVFSWPGMGRLVISSLGNRDYPVIQAVLLLFMVGFILVNLLVDIAYGLIDPRLRDSDARI